MEFNTTKSLAVSEEKPISDVQFFYHIIEDKNAQIAKLEKEIEEEKTRLENELEKEKDYSKAITETCAMVMHCLDLERRATTRKQQKEINLDCEKHFFIKMEKYWSKYEKVLDEI